MRQYMQSSSNSRERIDWALRLNWESFRQYHRGFGKIDEDGLNAVNKFATPLLLRAVNDYIRSAWNCEIC